LVGYLKYTSYIYGARLRDARDVKNEEIVQRAWRCEELVVILRKLKIKEYEKHD